MKTFVVVKPGSMSQEDKEALKEQDVIVVEHPEPKEMRVITAVDQLDAEGLFGCALATIKADGTTHSSFGRRVVTLLRPDKKD